MRGHQTYNNLITPKNHIRPFLGPGQFLQKAGMACETRKDIESLYEQED